jgi:ACR3 family arsenite transporter
MLGLAWATLPDQPTYRTGVIMVGLARCIAMVMIWNHLARGDINYCAILVIVNSVLQIALYSPMSIFFVNILSKEDALKLEYGKTAIAVLIYLGIPLAAGIVTRFVMLGLLGRQRFENVFLPWFGPLSLLGLLYTIIVICAEQATRILDNIGLVFRVFVPLTLYFVFMWAGTFALCYYLNHKRGAAKGYSYEAAVVQAFTAASNNFELAIAVCVAVYGVDSDQALAATIGPLVEVPVLLILTYVALWLRSKLKWDVTEEVALEMEPLPAAGAPSAAQAPFKGEDKVE